MNRTKYTKVSAWPWNKPTSIKWIEALTDWKVKDDVFNLLRINHGFNPAGAWHASRFRLYLQQEHGSGTPHHTVKFFVKLAGEFIFITKFTFRTDRPETRSRSEAGLQRHLQRQAVNRIKKMSDKELGEHLHSAVASGNLTLEDFRKTGELLRAGRGNEIIKVNGQPMAVNGEGKLIQLNPDQE